MGRKIASATLYVGLPVVCSLAGGFIGPRLNDNGMGFDQIGDVMTGLAAGAVAGIIAAVVLTRRLRDSSLRRVAIATAIVVALSVALVVVRFQSVMSSARANSTNPR